MIKANGCGTFIPNIHSCCFSLGYSRVWCRICWPEVSTETNFSRRIDWCEWKFQLVFKKIWRKIRIKINFIHFCSPRSLPWDQRTPLGYFSELIFSNLYAASYLISNGTLFLLFISICLHHLAFYEIVQYSLDKLDRLDGNRNEEMKVFYDLIQFHILVKRSVDSETFWNIFLKKTLDFGYFHCSMSMSGSHWVLSCTTFEKLYLFHIFMNIDIEIYVFTFSDGF